LDEISSTLTNYFSTYSVTDVFLNVWKVNDIKDKFFILHLCWKASMIFTKLIKVDQLINKHAAHINFQNASFFYITKIIKISSDIENNGCELDWRIL